MFWKTIIMPLVQRAGTAIGGLLLGYGVAESDVNMIVAGVVAAAGVTIDLIQAALARR